MQYPSLIQRACNPTDKLTSHPDAIVGKMKEEAIAGFKGLNPNELNTCDFSSQCFSDCVTRASPKTGVGLKHFIKLPTTLSPHATCIDKSSKQTWALSRHIPLILF